MSKMSYTLEENSAHRLHLADVETRPAFLRGWERVRHRQAHWAIEMLAEMFGVFFYCYAGVGATAAYVLANALKMTTLASLLTIGFAYALGVVLALVVASGTSGGHFNPAVTVTWVLFKGMPVAKGARYIFAQILGGYLTCLLIYLQYRTLIRDVEGVLIATGTYDAVQFTPAGPAGIFALYAPSPTLGLIFINEFVVDFFIGMVIFTCMDPTNFLAPPVMGPWLVGFAYAVAIWSYSPVGLAANAARDVGGRLAALTIWGSAASGGSYAAIAALTNIPATLLAYVVYQVIFTDSSRVITNAQKEFRAGHLAHMEHRHSVSSRSHLMQPNSPDLEKGTEQRVEHHRH
ncbi:aquaporin-like protein [Auriscalpium vulgare]|uniref:Aquaporin-like protein n=1 Tax=Auriscalpium vulgare TaxID=40419 RepID=A0ACB8R687_9AGAM|nr:aquaporin-like protein [Auriscalpium vulgare]